ncbi:hypothetical protein ILUMI_26978 [Ignelater luminosus]|uniref:Uncharacterized protein n=1 Tax=Ignelater luminosus TaxID=2038154 RepID=A0A8K0FX55_IGNLU|nr:hypothetical protein ILUMI_26978 [Ignelater luminosus]
MEGVSNWFKSNRPKDQFSALFKKALGELQSTTNQNEISGSRKAAKRRTLQRASICPDDIEEAKTDQQPVRKRGRSKRPASPESSSQLQHCILGYRHVSERYFVRSSLGVSSLSSADVSLKNSGGV